MTCTQADELALRANRADQARLDEHLCSCPACRAADEMIRAARIVPKHELEGRALRGAMSRIRSERDSAAAAKLEKFDRFGILNIAALAATILIIVVTIHNYSVKSPAELRETTANNNPVKRTEKIDVATVAALISQSDAHPLLNKLAPSPKLSLFDGGRFDLAHHQGREVVVLHFRSDEYYSFKYVTALAKVFEEYQAKGVVAYDVCGKCDAEHLKRYAQDHASFLLKHVIVDAGHKMSELYENTGSPQLYVIDKDGKVLWTHLGASDAIDIALPAVLDKVLAQPSWNDLPHDLADAVEAQDLAQLKSTLERGADVNAQDDWGASALMRAAWLGSKPMADLLIDKGANVNACDRQKWTALMFAAENGAGGIVERLLKAGADPKAESIDGWNAAKLATLNGHLQIADSLSEHSAESVDVFLKAVELERAPVVELLLAHGAKVNACNERGENALCIAIKKGNAEIAGILLRNGADANAGLLEAVQMRKLKMVKLLLDAKADPNAATSGTTPLEEARKMKNDEIIDLLNPTGVK